MERSSLGFIVAGGLLFAALATGVHADDFKRLTAKFKALADGCASGRPVDCEALARTATGDKNPERRYAATLQLEDQTLLTQIAKNDKAQFVRKGAVKKLTSQEVLAQFAQSDDDPIIREAATEKLTDQSILSHIARNDEDRLVKKMALTKLTSEAIAAFIAETPDWPLRRFAARRLALDRQALAGLIAGRDDDHELRLLVEEAIAAQACEGILASKPKPLSHAPAPAMRGPALVVPLGTDDPELDIPPTMWRTADAETGATARILVCIEAAWSPETYKAGQEDWRVIAYNWDVAVVSWPDVALVGRREFDKKPGEISVQGVLSIDAQGEVRTVLSGPRRVGPALNEVKEWLDTLATP